MKGSFLKEKTNCPQINELNAFADRELSFEQSTLIRNHVLSCKKCASHLAIRKIFRLLGKHQNIQVPMSDNIECPNDTMLADFCAGTNVTKSTRKNIVQHLAHCNSCRVKSVALFYEFSKPGRDRQEILSKSDNIGIFSADKWWSRFLYYCQGILPKFKSLKWAMIATTIIVFSTTAFFLIQRSTDNNIWLEPVVTLRKADDSSARRFILKEPDSGQIFKKDEPIQFSWPKIAGTINYRLVIYSTKADLIWDFETESTKVTFQETARMQSDQNYFWQVQAISATGKPVFSETRPFFIK